MDVGLVLSIRKQIGDDRPLEEIYGDALETAVYAEELGFDYISLTEHHFAPDAWTPSTLTLLAAMAARTSKIRLGTCVLLMALHNPIRIAEDAATVDLISNGRLSHLCIGAGSIGDEFATFGIDPAERWGRMFEGLEIVERAFTEEGFDHDGRYFQFPDVRMTTKPVQDRFPLWLSGFGPKTLARAGRRGYHLGGTSAWIQNGWQPFIDGAREAGHDPDALNQEVFVMGHVGENWDSAWDEAAADMHAWRDFYSKRDWLAFEKVPSPPPPPPIEELRNEPVSPLTGLVGGPNEFLAALDPLLKDSRVTHFAFGVSPGGMAGPERRKAMERFAADVMPTLRTWGRSPAVPAVHR